jgi:hypothetical protein
LDHRYYLLGFLAPLLVVPGVDRTTNFNVAQLHNLTTQPPCRTYGIVTAVQEMGEKVHRKFAKLLRPPVRYLTSPHSACAIWHTSDVAAHIRSASWTQAQALRPLIYDARTQLRLNWYAACKQTGSLSPTGAIMFHAIEFRVSLVLDFEISSEHQLQQIEVCRGIRTSAQIRPYVMETERGPVEVADLFFADGPTSRAVPFECFRFVD